MKFIDETWKFYLPLLDISKTTASTYATEVEIMTMQLDIDNGFCKVNDYDFIEHISERGVSWGALDHKNISLHDFYLPP